MRSALLRKLGLLALILPFSLASMCGLFLVDPDGVGNGVEGTWVVTEVCVPICIAMPDTGVALPENKGTVRSLSLVFDNPTSGSVVGRYQMVINGAGQPLQRQTGSFVYDGNDPGEVTISALKRTTTAKVTNTKSKLAFSYLEGNYPIVVKDPILGGKIKIPVTVKLRR